MRRLRAGGPALLILVALAPAACRRSRLRAHVDGAAVVVVDPSALGQAASEREPNNTVATAQPLVLAGGPLVAGVTGSLPGVGKNADLDAFKLVIPGGTDAAPPDAAALGARRLLVEVKPDPELAL